MSAFVALAVVVIVGDVFGSFASRLVIRPGIDPPVWAAPLISKWAQRMGVDDEFYTGL
jgi:hypothetical protein